MSWTCLGHVLDMSWTCLGHVLDMSWTCLGHVLDMSWTCLGHVLDMFWTCLGYVLDLFRICFGYVLHMFPTCFIFEKFGRSFGTCSWTRHRDFGVTGSPGEASNLGLTSVQVILTGRGDYPPTGTIFCCCLPRCH